MFHDPDFTPFTPREKPSFLAVSRNYLENYAPEAYRTDFFSAEAALAAPSAHALCRRVPS